MQPIIILGAAVVGVALLGTGFLGEPWNNIELWVQELGWGEENLLTPISHAYIDLELKKEINDNGTTEQKCIDLELSEEEEAQCIKDADEDDFFNNVIKACSFHSDDSLDEAAQDPFNLSPALIICKLTNEEGLAIAEGKQILNGVQPDIEDPDACLQRDEVLNGYEGSTTIRIDICQTAYDFSNEVQDVHDIKIIVENALNRMDPTIIPVPSTDENP